jgi:hypothetical protein
MAIVENVDVVLCLLRSLLLLWLGDDLAVLDISDCELLELVGLLESFDIRELLITRFKLKLTRLIELILSF